MSVSHLTSGKEQSVARPVERFFSATAKFRQTLVRLEEQIMSVKSTIDEQVIQKEFDGAVEELLKEGDELAKAVSDKLLVKKVKDEFRKLVGCWVKDTQWVDRAYRKPRGYPGDAKLLEAIYDNKPIFDRGMSSCFDRNFLNDTYAVAIRNRKEKIKDLLRQFLNVTPLSSVRLLNLACGACRELKELFAERIWDRQFHLTCVDHDEEALALARDHLAILPPNFAAKYIKEDILSLCKSANYAEMLSGQHIIYSIGLADYLPDRILKKMLTSMYRWLEPQGLMLLTHKDKNRHNPLAPDWFCNWTFVPRGQEDLLRLLQEAGVDKTSVTWAREASGCVLFALITK